MDSTTIGSVARMTVICAGTLVLAFRTDLPVSAGQTTNATSQIDLAERLKAGRIRAVNGEVSALADRPGAVHIEPRPGSGGASVAWIAGSDFAEGTIEVVLRGRDVFQQSFLGLAFHATDDNTYESVYVRPFNYRATDPVRHQHAVQYMALPEYEWPRLRKEFPEEFENPVDASVEPEGWVNLRLVIAAQRVQIYVGEVTTPTLEVRRLASANRGMIGVWGNGDFMNLRVTPAK